MTTITETPKTQTSGSQHWLVLALILAMLGLRYFVTVAHTLTDTRDLWISSGFELGTYLLVAVFLILTRDSLADYHITPLAIWMLILFKPIETLYLAKYTFLNSPLAFPKLPSLFIWMIAIGLIFYFRSRLFKNGAIQWAEVKWLLLGALAGLFADIILAYPMSFQVEGITPTKGSAFFLTLLNNAGQIPYQIGYAAVSEEPVFRGFLWGFLRKSGWKNGWIWVFQAVLFSLAHFYYLKSAPISFWIIVPALALMMGWLAWRSRSIATSMMAHGVSNGLGYVLGILAALLRLKLIYFVP